jgi:hypothetical protein
VFRWAVICLNRKFGAGAETYSASSPPTGPAIAGPMTGSGGDPYAVSSVLWLASVSLLKRPVVTTSARGYGSPRSRGRHSDWSGAAITTTLSLLFRVRGEALWIGRRGQAGNDGRYVKR